MLSPSWLFICLLEAPEGIYAVFWLGLVTGASENYWKGSCTLSKKEKWNQSMSQTKNANKVWKKLKIIFLCCNFKKKPHLFIKSISEECFKCNRIHELPIFSCNFGAIICLVWRSQWGFTVSRPTAWQFTVSRQKMLYSTVNRQKYSLRLTVKKFLGVSNLTVSADLDGIPAPKEFLNWKNQFSCQKKHSF